MKKEKKISARILISAAVLIILAILALWKALSMGAADSRTEGPAAVQEEHQEEQPDAADAGEPETEAGQTDTEAPALTAETEPQAASGVLTA